MDLDPASCMTTPTTRPGLTRRQVAAGAGALALAPLYAAFQATREAPISLVRPTAAVADLAPPRIAPPVFLEDLKQRSFRFFWETTDARTGLAPDRWPARSFASIAAVGFALTAYPIGVARGWITREQARDRALATLRFFHDAPQGPEPTGTAGHKGFFYHFLDMASGTRFGDTELSTIDTALLLAGALHVQSFFDGADEQETQIRTIADALYARVDWTWAQLPSGLIARGWQPENGFIGHQWEGYCEAKLLYLLAIGSPTMPVAPETWNAYTASYGGAWATEYGQTYLRFAPLFGHQFTHAWVDLRGISDAYMRERGIDYFENSRRATLAQRNYAIANPAGWAGYGADVWGVTPCDGPTDAHLEYGGKVRKFISYAGRGMAEWDDGTIAPYGAGSSIVFAPEEVSRALVTMRERYGEKIFGKYGFFAFNPSFTYSDVPLRHGRIEPGVGWVNNDYLGIEVGPLLAMLANHKDEVVWKDMRRNEHLKRGLQRAGFTGGWLG
jgi:hypothetical protein